MGLSNQTQCIHLTEKQKPVNDSALYLLSLTQSNHNREEIAEIPIPAESQPSAVYQSTHSTHRLSGFSTDAIYREIVAVHSIINVHLLPPV